jgi:hypothetical protein
MNDQEVRVQFYDASALNRKNEAFQLIKTRRRMGACQQRAGYHI